jgi:DNA polymerase-3 subunit epsilon
MLDQKTEHALATKGVSKRRFNTILNDVFEDPSIAFDLLVAQGYPLVRKNDRIFFQTTHQELSKATFCIVDIETNGSKAGRDQVIEIGAVTVRDGKIIDTFESLVHATTIGKYVEEITGITLNDLKDAPSLSEVMYKFKTFLSDHIFVAHNINFDYKFLSAMFERIGLAPLGNRQLCTIDLAKRTIEEERYGLAHLNAKYHFHPEATHHRALSDTFTTYKLFNHLLKFLPEEISTAENLILFSKSDNIIKKEGNKERGRKKS